MTAKEARKVINIMVQTDGNCWYCASHLIAVFIHEFPEHEKLARRIFKKVFDRELGEV